MEVLLKSVVNIQKAQTTETSSSLPFLEGSTTSTVTEFTSIVLPSDSSIEAITSAAEDADVEVTVKQESSSGTWISYIITYIPFIVLIVFFLCDDEIKEEMALVER